MLDKLNYQLEDEAFFTRLVRQRFEGCYWKSDMSLYINNDVN